MQFLICCLLALALGGPLAASFEHVRPPQPVMQQTPTQRESSSSSRTRIPIKGIIVVILAVVGAAGWVIKKVTGKKDAPQAQVYQQAQTPMQGGYGPSPYAPDGTPVQPSGPATGPRPAAGPRPVAQRPAAPGQRPQAFAPGQRPPTSAPGQRPVQRPQQRPPQKPGV